MHGQQNVKINTYKEVWSESRPVLTQAVLSGVKGRLWKERKKVTIRTADILLSC